MQELKRRAVSFCKEYQGCEADDVCAAKGKGQQAKPTCPVKEFLQWLCGQSSDDDRCVLLPLAFFRMVTDSSAV